MCRENQKPISHAGHLANLSDDESADEQDQEAEFMEDENVDELDAQEFAELGFELVIFNCEQKKLLFTYWPVYMQDATSDQDRAALEAFMSDKPPERRNLADIIMEKFKTTNTFEVVPSDAPKMPPGLNPKVVEVYTK